MIIYFCPQYERKVVFLKANVDRCSLLTLALELRLAFEWESWRTDLLDCVRAYCPGLRLNNSGLQLMYADTISIGTAVSWCVQTAAADISPPRARTGHQLCRSQQHTPSPPLQILQATWNMWRVQNWVHKTILQKLSANCLTDVAIEFLKRPWWTR